MKRALQLLSLFALLSPCLCAPSATTAPLVVYPIRSQRPPVARVGRSFSWSLLPGTFNTSTGTNGMSFKAENLPSWATFSPETQTFSGTPSGSDSGFSTVTIRAYNSANSASVSDTLRLLVANGQSPTVKLPLESQLGNGAVLGSAKYDHATEGVSVPPNWSWSVGLLRDTFVADHKTGIYYTAYEAGTTSLPSWIKFNTATATFDGVSPNEQKDTSIVVYGSDYFGYGDVQQTFRITVTAHVLDLLATLPPLNATAQSIVNYTIPFDAFTIDGSPKNSSTRISAKVDLSQTPFLSYDEAHSSISGTLPTSLAPFNNVSIPITFSAPNCHNLVSTQLSLRVVPGLFTAPVLPPLYVHPGENFNLNLAQYTSNLNATYSLGSIAPSSVGSWLQFTDHPLAISGKAPSTLESKSQKIDIDLEASGLNGLRSTAHLPVIFATDSSKDGNYYKRSGLSAGVKLWLIIIFGTLGGILLLIFIMRTCRIYCSADGKRDRESFQDVYHPYYTYANGKMEESKSSDSPIKGTPYSVGDTLIDPRSPAWNSKAGIGGPMMAITKTETHIGGSEPLPPSGFKRLDVFNVFSKPSSGVRTISPTQSPYLQGLGIVESNYRVHLGTKSESKPAEEAEEDWHSGSDESGSRVADTGANPTISSEGGRSSWNTTGSSSLFYSETQGDGSDLGSSSRSRRWLETPSGSTPRRRKDFVPSPRMANQEFSSPSGSSAEGVDVGTIRMVVNDGTSSSPARSMTDEDVKACSESIGAIKTASYRRITADYSSASGAGTSEPSSGAYRPKLVPFQGRQIPRDEDSLSPSASEETSSNPGGSESHLRLNQSDEADHTRRHRLSIQSDQYRFEPSLSKPGSPATSAIFFSPSDQPRYPTSKPAPLFKNYVNGASSYVRSHSPLYESHTAESFSEISNPLEGLSNQNPVGGSAVFSIGVGEPFHMTPSVKPETSTGTEGLDHSLVLGDVHTYYALTDYPNQPELDRKQLPDWLHFDASECEIWGIPRKIDAGPIAIQIVESKPFSRSYKAPLDPSNSIDSPSLGRQTEEVVARFTLDVVDKSSFQGSSQGNVTTVTF
ncbi:hypothetical protein MJO29_005339 [Puccinia striiformis f. sp. tritici]|uniref:Dystroglycan-type cadherin-like domain-containing protein n=4 Tax=Puccinia striiformis TaxID=27350 RepID=A0A0L0VGQ9_9BASI|nr:hypothetical protein MJO29_005339 [Puccinia striiformis f. sp. tritici]KNE98443.1 hypothetical protein PSTG_08357 [Puccinia striiformis f. sp. tritici PST-78]POV98117.1 hypothetical protein PSTT_14628 [Puccinia striiformis]POW19022.1 hypothetical protein PSHT_05160 [Puccinia striiformis]